MRNLLDTKKFSVLILLACILQLVILTACGFHPVYGVNKYTAVGVEEHLAATDISNIPNREGQYLRNALIDRFYRSSRPAYPAYVLDVREVKEHLIDLDITKTADTTRGQMRLESGFTLKDKRTGKVLLSRDLRSITSYNLLGSEFATRVTEHSARENALDDLARQIELQLSLYFKKNE